ncbi:hypothetical protein VDG1235_4675 [Verrucomicrobiia bacterium DG1235]|nr:hypothetical protein VDG1235_4675 [Verrucomicrobiae bacterium DG1235]
MVVFDEAPNMYKIIAREFAPDFVAVKDSREEPLRFRFTLKAEPTYLNHNSGK